MRGSHHIERVYWRGEDEYELARSQTVFHGYTPERFPAAVVQAQSAEDVVAAIALASERGLQVSVRSGGHSWAGNHIRDGVLLVDVSALDSCELDIAARTAVIGPGVRSDWLMRELRSHGLTFPGGHCVGVGLGGFLLQGGFGWNSRVWGPACMSVEAVDVVTAAGDLVRADAEQNTELYWAARGAGPGYFGVVTAFHVRLYEWPGVAHNRAHVYPIELLDDVYKWAYAIGPTVPEQTELLVIMTRQRGEEPKIVVTAPTIARDAAEAEAALAFLETCPVRDRAEVAQSGEVSIDELYAVLSENHPDGSRCTADGMWTHAPIDDLLPGLHRIAETIPPAPAYMLFMNWGPVPERPDMAFSLEDQTYIAVYSTWTDPGLDGRYAPWPTERMREMESVATGVQLADENLDARPAPCMAPENARRLAELRDRHDPDRRFFPGPYG